jgi:nicotinate-nucleotide pyrophosphorylase (carboxylating)
VVFACSRDPGCDPHPALTPATRNNGEVTDAYGPETPEPTAAPTAHLTLPQKLAAGDPGWQERVDVVVIGSGIAGLTTALRARSLGRVLVVTKDVLSAGSTRWAMGGVAAAIGPGDTPQDHLNDTLAAGAGLCDEDAVRALVTEGPAALRELIDLGATFDTTPLGELQLTREGGHHRDRIVHAGGDATGAEIQRALAAAVHQAPEIDVIEHALALDLVPGDLGVAGVTVHVLGEGEQDGVGVVWCRAVVLASGGLGQVFSATTNPAVSTGDGVALAFRAGARLRDLEFVQFHPTVLWLGPDARGQQPLVSEAVRGEGAFLVDDEGVRFMEGQHELADLAPRDVVAKAIMRRMREQGRPHMWLEGRHLGEETWNTRFPTVLAACRAHGIDPVTQLIPVAPACHYASGGVATDLNGRTTVPGLYACGEVACSGVHGANRLASNSLLEGLVFGRRIAADMSRLLPAHRTPVPDQREAGAVDSHVVPQLRNEMTEDVGVLRNAEGLAAASRALAEMAARPAGSHGPAAWEATNLATVASAIIAAASVREETRGSHWREDFPDTDEAWALHVDVVARDEGNRFGLDLVAATDDASMLDVGYLNDLARAALEEDLNGGVDVTSVATIAPETTAVGDFVARADGVLAGLDVAEAVVRVVAPEVRVERHYIDGAAVRRGDVLMTVKGPAQALLTAERTALNLLCHLSGIATATRAWVDAVAGTGARIRDTRKTTPLMRSLEKYAVRCGGGVNHRMSLSDEALIKDNHVVAAGGVTEAFHRVRKEFPDVPVQVEVDTLAQLAEAVEAGVDSILLDNMSTDEMRRAVAFTGGRARLEASGGLTLDRAREVAETGVEFLAVGALTHSVIALDIALDLRMAPTREADPS